MKLKQRQKHTGLKFFSGAGFLMLILLLLFPTQVLAEGSQTVRVAVNPLGQFQQYNDGDVYGYNIDFLDEIAKYTHWNYVYVEANDFNDACDMLEEAEKEYFDSKYRK